MTREEAENRFFEWANQSNLELQSESDFLRTQIAIARTAFMAGWDAALQDVVEPPEPTPTEMVQALLEKGWIPMVSAMESEGGGVFFREGENYPAKPLEIAYRKAFPLKKKVTEYVWKSKMNGSIITYTPPSNSKDWIKGQFIYEEEE